MVRKGINKKSLKIIGFLFLFVSLSILVFEVTKINFKEKQEEEHIEEFMKQEVIEEVKINSKEDNTEERTETVIKYNMVIQIPKIGVKKVLYDIDSKFNSVDYGIEILQKSDMPNITNGNLILASHNGNSSVSYFNKLDRLIQNDEVYIFYDGLKYIYQLNNIYEVNKTGEVLLNRSNEETILALITCKKNEDKQIIYIFNLISKGNYNG